jgi:exo-beta-1,3-glucanase (GH17 family)
MKNLSKVLALVFAVALSLGTACNSVDPGGSGGGRTEHEGEMSLPTAYRLHGVNFGPFEGDQDPNMGAHVSADQIERRMGILTPHTQWIRTFGCTNGLEHAGRIARSLGVKAAMGTWIGPDPVANEAELESLIREAKNGNVDLAIIGSEVLLRGDLSPAELLACIRRFRTEVPNVQVTTADVYSELLKHPEVMAECDVILANYYPYWEGVDAREAMAWLHARHQRVVAAAGAKAVMVSETGWPSAGDTIADAVPSPENAAFFFKNFISWARAEGVDYFYFEAFDEPWKAAYEGPQGAFWGIWDKDGNLKPGMEAVFDGETMDDNWTCWDIPGGLGTPMIEFTSVPPIGSFDNLIGQVWHVLPQDHGVAVYIKVSGGWWSKPFFSDPVTEINCDGSWACDITTGGTDELATEIAAFLIPLGYSPPLSVGLVGLPADLYVESLDYVEVTRN